MQSLLDVLVILNNGSVVVILKEAKGEFGECGWMMSSSDEKW